MTTLVLDASVALAWILPDASSPYADHVQAALENGAAHVPAIWPLEFANGLAVAERRGRLTPADRNRVARLLQPLAVAVEPVTVAEALDRVLPLARAHRLTACHAAYLDLARRLEIRWRRWMPRWHRRASANACRFLQFPAAHEMMLVRGGAVR